MVKKEFYETGITNDLSNPLLDYLKQFYPNFVTCLHHRVEEFTKLQKMGIAGVKIDFFESEKQDMIKYYLDILEDAAQFEMMIYFHGCLVSRGWARTYPNLMTYEGVRGAEWYNNTPDFTMPAPEHNTILPFTRNVVGSMDYTPVTFTISHFHMLHLMATS